MVSPFGRRTVKGVRDLTLFRHGALTKRKWPVHPDSTMAVSCCLRRGEVRKTSDVELLFKVVAPEHHSLLAWLPTMFVKLLPLPQPPVRARTDARATPSAQRATQLRSVLARVYAVSIQNQITNTVP
jgi:hypothetical protein